MSDTFKYMGTNVNQLWRLLHLCRRHPSRKVNWMVPHWHCITVLGDFFRFGAFLSQTLHSTNILLEAFPGAARDFQSFLLWHDFPDVGTHLDLGPFDELRQLQNIKFRPIDAYSGFNEDSARKVVRGTTSV